MIEERGRMRSLTADADGVAGAYTYSKEVGQDQFIRIHAVHWQIVPGASGEGVYLYTGGSADDVNVVYGKSGSLGIMYGSLAGPIDLPMGKMLMCLQSHANAGTNSRLNCVYQIITLKQNDGQPINPTVCSPFSRMIGAC